MDEKLSNKLTIQEAKDYKKILAALQKSKLMDTIEIEVLF